MPCSRVTINGVDYINLENDTVTSSNDIVAGKYGHLNTGERVLGTGQSGGLETVTIWPEQTVTATTADTSGYTIYLDNITENLVNDTNYIVTMDGVSYLCYAHTISNDIYAGDLEVVWGTPTNAIYPFAIGSYANNRTQWMVADNSPHTVKIERVVSMFGSGNVTYETIVPETTVSATAGSWTRLTSGTTPSLIEGEYYAYTINGVERVATATLAGNNIYLSDIIYDWGDDGFAIGYDIVYGGIWLNASKTSGEYTVKVDKITFSDSGSGGSTRTTIVPEQTGNYTERYNQVNFVAPLIVGEVYIYTIDGVESQSTAFDNYGTVGLGSPDTTIGFDYGNGVMYLSITDTSLRTTHTIKVEQESSGGGGGDSATLITKTITENGTYSASSDSADGYSSVTVNVPTSIPVTWETKSDQNITITSDGTYNYAVWTYTEPLQADETYRITWGENGTQYICETVYTSGSSTYDGYYLGNISIVNLGENTGEPFLLYRNNNTRMVVTTTQETGSWHIKVEKQVPISSTLITKTITQNGTYSASSDDADGYSSVTVNVSSSTPTLQSKTVTPTESTQTITADSNYDGLDSVEVGAISSTYIGSGIARKSSTDLTASGATVTVPSGYYEELASKSISSGSATTPATTITANPSISVSSSGLITATASASQNITPTVSAGYVSTGTSGTVTVSGSKTQQLTALGATTYNTSTTDQTIASGRYITGTQTIKAVTVSGLSAENIASGVTVKVGDANDDDRIVSVTGTLAFQTIHTGSSTPSSSLGSNGDIYIQS